MKKRVVTAPAPEETDTLAGSEKETDALAGTEVAVVRIDAPPPRRRSGDGYLLLGLLAGAVYGAVAGLLLAPRKGEETRRQLMGQAEAASAGPAVPAPAHEAVAQVLQYSTPTAADSAWQADQAAGTPTVRAPGL